MTEILYDNEQKYEQEFNDNLSECIRTYQELFAKGGAADDLVRVRAPGRQPCVTGKMIAKMQEFDAYLRKNQHHR